MVRVATIVTKLFNIVEHDVAVFGKKDNQQWRIIQRMALSISKSLMKVKSDAKMGVIKCKELKDAVFQTITQAGGKIDYVEIVDQESLEAVEEINNHVVVCIAAWFGKVRVIDNMEINNPVILGAKHFQNDQEEFKSMLCNILANSLVF